MRLSLVFGLQPIRIVATQNITKKIQKIYPTFAKRKTI